MADARWRLCTPAGSAGAIALFEIEGDADGALAAIGQAPVRTGEVRLRDFFGIDTGIVARWTDRTIHLMPHGGPGLARSLADRLTAAGIAPAREDPSRPYPEARDEIESRMLGALARAASPLAIDLLLDQPRRWRESGARGARADAVALNRLIVPPLVVMLGPSNIGKSTLTNALAGRTVSIVADEPGTTRDHVGVLLDLAGLVVRFVDTPGVRESAGAIERDAAGVAEGLAARADLVLLCGDRVQPPPATAHPSSLRIALRSDLGTPAWGHDAAVCAPRAEGLSGLVTTVRDRLVSPAALRDPGPWEFWTAPAG